METRAYKTYTLKIPQINVAYYFNSSLTKLRTEMFSILTSIKQAITNRSPKGTINTFRNSPKINFKKILPIILIIVTAVVTVYWLGKLLTTKSSTSAQDSRVSVEQASASQNLGKEFTFPLKDSKGKKVTDMKIVVDSAELRNEIIVQGKRAVAVKGRKFLILTIKITNSYTKSLEINSRDYFRLTVNNKTEDLLAPEIHNDPVKVQPTSTKFARIGWPINDTDSQLTLLVGEIEGEKTKVELNLK